MYSHSVNINLSESARI